MTEQLKQAAQRLFKAYDEGDSYAVDSAISELRALTTSQPAQAGEVDERKVVLPAGWVPLTIEYEPGYPEEVAFGPQRMMDRLKKWLDKHFAAITTPPAAQATPPLIDSMGMPTSCGKPLCSPDDHHPLCRLHKPAAKAEPEPVADAQVCKHGEQVFYGSGPVMHKASGVIFDTIIAAADPSSLIPLTPMQPAAQATPEPRLFIGACITDGRLHATVQRLESNGNVTLVATAEMDAASLHGHDCIAQMTPATPEPQQAAGEPVAMWVDLKDGEIVQLGDRLFSGGKTWRTVDQESQLAGREYHAKHWWPMQRAATSPAPGVPDVEDLRDRLVAISAAVADSDDRAAQAMLGEILRALAAAQAKGAGHV